MFATVKKILKVGVVTVILLGVTGAAFAALAGGSRTRAVVHQVQSAVMEKIDGAIEDPTALRAQLREMEKEYPEKIAQVRGDLLDLQREIRELERERAISDRVVALVEQDLGPLQLEVAAARAEGGNELTAWGSTSVGPRRSKEELRLDQLQNQRLHYQGRVADADHNLLYLRHQEGRLQELLGKLEGEHADFQTQIAGLSRQIDSIARNDRLIGLLEKRNRTIEECSRYEAVSLDQITDRLTMIRTRQEAELDTLSTAESGTNYEQAARMQLAQESMHGAPAAQPRDLKTAGALRTAEGF